MLFCGELKDVENSKNQKFECFSLNQAFQKINLFDTGYDLEK